MSLCINPTFTCPSKAFCIEEMSSLQFCQLSFFYRQITIRMPNPKDISIAKFLVGPFSHDLLPFNMGSKKRMEQLILDNGYYENVYFRCRLYIMRCACQEEDDINPCGAMLIRISKIDRSFGILFLAIRDDFQKKYLSTIFLSYAVKLAQEEHADSLQLCTTKKGIIPYMNFGFISEEKTPLEWKKLSVEDRIEFLKAKILNRNLILRFKLPDVRNMMREQLYRALFEYNK